VIVGIFSSTSEVVTHEIDGKGKPCDWAVAGIRSPQLLSWNGQSRGSRGNQTLGLFSPGNRDKEPQ
jgi:hypothetical protein